MLKHLFKTRPGGRIGDDLYALAVAQARNPAFYTRLGVEDRIDARFELYTLHVLLLVMRLRDEDTVRGQETAQTLFDVYVSALYGRMTAYEGPLRQGDAEALAQALARNVYGADAAEHAGALARYALAARTGLGAQDFNAVLARPAWGDV